MTTIPTPKCAACGEFDPVLHQAEPYSYILCTADYGDFWAAASAPEFNMNSWLVNQRELNGYQTGVTGIVIGEGE